MAGPSRNVKALELIYDMLLSFKLKIFWGGCSTISVGIGKTIFVFGGEQAKSLKINPTVVFAGKEAVRNHVSGNLTRRVFFIADRRVNGCQFFATPCRIG